MLRQPSGASPTAAAAAPDCNCWELRTDPARVIRFFYRVSNSRPKNVNRRVERTDCEPKSKPEATVSGGP
jgi:hypothetical protein